MSWFNTYERDGDGLTREVITKVDLKSVTLSEWSDDELGFRLAVIYPEVDGYGHLTASDEVKNEIMLIRDELTGRGYDWTSNLRYNELCVGFGWLPGFDRLEEFNESMHTK